MNSDFNKSAMAWQAILSELGAFHRPKPKTIKLVDEPKYTINLFDTFESLKDKVLSILEESVDGKSYLCVVKNSVQDHHGLYLIDVDKRDIKREERNVNDSD